MRLLILFLCCALAACSDVVLGDRIDDDMIAQIEVRNPGLISYDVWLVVRDDQLAVQAEHLLLTGLGDRNDALTFVQHIGWDSERVIVQVVLNDKLSDQDLIMTNGTKVSIITDTNH